MTFQLSDLDELSESKIDQANLQLLAQLVCHLNTQGHNPATSGNYSHRCHEFKNIAFISESGVDKSTFTEKNFIPIEINTKKTPSNHSHRKTSDETDVHLAIYQVTDAECILHSHMLDSLLFSNLFKGKAFADLENLELLKGFKGIKTHETSIQIPIFENTQDIEALAQHIKPVLKCDSHCYGILLRDHGIYVWGESVQGAKRHLEVFEYVFRYYLNSRENKK